MEQQKREPDAVYERGNVSVKIYGPIGLSEQESESRKKQVVRTAWAIIDRMAARGVYV